MDLARSILLQLESQNYISDQSDFTSQEVAYHVALLEDAGLITQELYTNMYISDSLQDGIRMTWAGHEFLDAARSKTFWDKAKKTTLEKTGSVSFEILKSVLVQLAKNAVET